MQKIAALVLAIGLCVSVEAQQRTEYRAMWVDTFNTVLNNHANVVTVVENAKKVKANAILAQVRRRGDAWFLRGDPGFLEPKPDGVAIQAGFDPLQDLIDTAHAEGIEVHAFVIIGAVWNSNPNPVSGGAAPTNPNHVFNLHGGYDAVTKTIIHTPNNWLTRSLIADGTAGITYQGHRVGAEFWLDLGHPDAAEYTHKVMMSLIRNYAIDGLHLDRIRYPEISIGGQTPSTGTSTGYNSTSVARFNQRHGGTGNPTTGNPLWMQWRRDQVTNFVRRLYVEAIEAKPQMKMSAALIAFGGGPVIESQWSSAEAYWRVYQDWRSWTEEGIIDIAMPMNYKREHIAAQETQFTQWATWLKNHQYNRMGLVGLGNFINSIEGTIRQTRRSLAPSTQGNSGAGVAYFSMATSNTYSNSGVGTVPPAVANPYSVPAGQMTPVRSYAEFAAGLTTSKSVDGVTLYEPIPNDGGIFQQPASIPVMTWKTQPTKGHVKGFVRRADNTILDTSAVTVTNAMTSATKSSQSDGKGFYGAVDLNPGLHSASAVLGPETRHSCFFNVTAGQVARADINSTTAPSFQKPQASFEAEAAVGMCSASVSTGALTITDGCSLARTIDAMRSDGASLGAPFPAGITTITWTVTDATGTSNFVQTVTVRDTQAPQIQAPPNVLASTDPGSCTATVSVGTPAASDNCSYTLTKSRSDGAAIDAPYPKGVTTITWTATDPGGRTASATQTITVADTEPPALQAPAGIEVTTAPNECDANVSVGVATATDNCGPAAVAGARSDGKALSAAYPKGVTTITWTATDSNGLTSTASQTITVRDAEAPVITRLRTSRDELWPPNHHMISVTVSYDAQDNCGAVTTSLSVTSNEPEDGLGEGDTGPDYVVVNNHEVQLRAERSGSGNGRIYTITVTATDASGNQSQQSIAVRVPHSMGNN